MSRHNQGMEIMNHFPEFMKDPRNGIDTSQQNTEDIEGYFFQGADDTQMAFWECHSDRTSEKHTHDFDEYMVCVAGEYTAYLDDKETVLKPGGELVIPKGTEQWGKCKAGTRTIHAFGGKRIRR
jgi:quercetin dioxygenase-like cupin family protein